MPDATVRRLGFRARLSLVVLGTALLLGGCVYPAYPGYPGYAYGGPAYGYPGYGYGYPAGGEVVVGGGWGWHGGGGWHGH